MNRRNFLAGMAGILASGFAPAAVGSGVLMPVRKIARASHFGELEEVFVVSDRASRLGATFSVIYAFREHAGPDDLVGAVQQFVTVPEGAFRGLRPGDAIELFHIPQGARILQPPRYEHGVVMIDLKDLEATRG